MVSIADVRRISSNLKMKPILFVEKLPVDEEESLTHEFRSGTEYYYLALKKTEDSRCVFHKDGLCSIHDFKPGVCHLYPFTLDGLKIVQRKKILCPVGWRVQEFSVDRILKIAGDYVRYWDELREQDRFAAEWNKKNGGTFEELLELIEGGVDNKSDASTVNQLTPEPSEP
jgi:Fe-S-cluster containining protein